MAAVVQPLQIWYWTFTKKKNSLADALIRELAQLTIFTIARNMDIESWSKKKELRVIIDQLEILYLKKLPYVANRKNLVLQQRKRLNSWKKRIKPHNYLKNKRLAPQKFMVWNCRWGRA